MSGTDLIQTETDNLLAALRASGYQTEHVSAASDGGMVVNIARNGHYALTLTLTRTPGYDAAPADAA